MGNSYKQNKAYLIKTFAAYRICKYFSTPSTEQVDYIQKVDQALERLPEEERELITLRYLQIDSEYITDQSVHQKIGISGPHYIKVRDRAFYKLIHMLSVNAKTTNEVCMMQPPITLNPYFENDGDKPRAAYLIENDRAIVADGLISLVRVVPDVEPGEYKPANPANHQIFANGINTAAELEKKLDKLKSMSAYDLLTRHYDWFNEHFDIDKQIEGR